MVCVGPPEPGHPPTSPLTLLCDPHKSLNPSDVQFPRRLPRRGGRGEADLHVSSGSLRSYSGSIFASPLCNQIPPAESPDLGGRQGPAAQGGEQISGCGAFPRPHLGRQGGSIVLILWRRKRVSKRGSDFSPSHTAGQRQSSDFWKGPPWGTVPYPTLAQEVETMRTSARDMGPALTACSLPWAKPAV